MAVIDVEPFVKMVKENDLLYNKNRTDYKDHEKKMQCWNNIAQIYDVPVGVVLAKWKSLREKYIKERKQVKIHGLTSLKWEHYHLFKFLDPYILPRNRPRRRLIDVSMMSSSVLEDSSSQGMGNEDQELDPRGGGFSGNSSTPEDYSAHCSTSFHPSSSSSFTMDPHGTPRDHATSSFQEKRLKRTTPASVQNVYCNDQVSNFAYMLHAKAERIKDTCQMLTEDELFGCEIIEELKRKKSQKVKREIKMKILGIFNEYDGVGED